MTRIIPAVSSQFLRSEPNPKTCCAKCQQGSRATRVTDLCGFNGACICHVKEVAK